MDPKAIQKIENKIKGSLQNCYIKDNWPQYESVSKHVDSLGEEILKHKKEWLDLSDVFSIFYDLVYEAIGNIGTDPPLEGILWDILGEKKGLNLTESIKDYIISIPRTFDVYLPLSGASRDLPASIQLGENISIEIFEKAEQVPGGYSKGLTIIPYDYALEPNKVYIRQRIAGYCRNNLENVTNKKAINNFKILIQQGICRKIFNVDIEEKAGLGLYRSLTHHQVPKAHLVSVDQARTPDKVLKTELPIDFSKLLNSIDFNWEGELFVKAKESGEKEQATTATLKKVIELIDCKAEESKRVKSSIQWCFDSYAVENKTLAFLQICIGLEALLGDDKEYSGGKKQKDTPPLTETLADRCSYLISNTIKGRKAVKRQFIELYDIRSTLVHGNATELNSNQMFYLNWGRTILEYAILKEIKHLNLEKA